MTGREIELVIKWPPALTINVNVNVRLESGLSADDQAALATVLKRAEGLTVEEEALAGQTAPLA